MNFFSFLTKPWKTKKHISWLWKKCYSEKSLTSRQTRHLHRIRHLRRFHKLLKLELANPLFKKKHHLWGRNVVRHGKSLKRLVNLNWRKPRVEQFNGERKSIWTSTFQQELWGFALNSCAALRNSLIGEVNWKKRLLFAREPKIWTLEQCKKVMWSDEYRFILFQNDGHIRIGKRADDVIHPSGNVMSTD